MILNLKNLPLIQDKQEYSSSSTVLSLPEKVLQFGTGSLLRGLCDFYIDQANRKHIFNGRIAVVKSTDQGDTSKFQEQDNIYTLVSSGIVNNTHIQQRQIITSISRVLHASTEWDKILDIARNKETKIIISNTTEAGIVATDDNVFDSPPHSFPAKLTSVLYARFLAYNGSADSGLIILPTELISNNADKLKEIMLSLAEKNNMSREFRDWIIQYNYFCNTLVDRIVPGQMEQYDWGYQDGLHIMAEPFHLWVIESSHEYVRQTLSFAQADPQVKIVVNLEHFKEIKLRLLNAVHILTCGLGILSDHPYVRNTLSEPYFEKWVNLLISKEIIPYLQSLHISTSDIDDFAAAVVDRFKNPTLDHNWEAIAQNYTEKLKQRVFPLLIYWYRQHSTPPTYMALGFAAYLLYYERLHSTQNTASASKDPYTKQLEQHFKNAADPISAILSDTTIWGESMESYSQWIPTVRGLFENLKERDVVQTIHNL